MRTSVDRPIAQPIPRNFRELMSKISDVIVQRLSESGEYTVSLNDIAGDVADHCQGIETDEFEFQDLLADFLQGLLRPLIYIGNDDLGGESLDVLLLGADHVFSVLHQSGLEPVLGIKGKCDSPGPMVFEAQIRIRHCLSWAPISFPDRITFTYPLTNQDVRRAIQLAMHDGPTIEIAPLDRTNNAGYLATFRAFVASRRPEIPEVELLDPRTVASRYADLVVAPGVDNGPDRGRLWEFDPADDYVHAIEAHLQHLSTPIQDEPQPETEPSGPLSVAEQRHSPCPARVHPRPEDEMITFWVAYDGEPTSPDIALSIIAEDASGWRETITSTKGGGPSAPYFESFSPIHVLPEAGWSQELAEYHASLFNMSLTAVVLTAAEYDAFLRYKRGATADFIGPS